MWHHWTEKHEYVRSQFPIEERPLCKREYAVELIEHNELHGFVACDDNDIIEFCNVDLKDNYFRFSKENSHESWIDINEKVLSEEETLKLQNDFLFL